MGHVLTNELRVDLVEHNTMLTEAFYAFKEKKEKMALIMFEAFNVSGFFCCPICLIPIYWYKQCNNVIIHKLKEKIKHFFCIKSE